MECEPAVSEEVVKVALPEALSVPEPSVVAPSLNVTVPVGVTPGTAAVIVAVKVTDWPEHDGLSEETRAEAVSDLMTVCVNTGDVLPLKPLVAAYTAVIECAPTV